MSKMTSAWIRILNGRGVAIGLIAFALTVSVIGVTLTRNQVNQSGASQELIQPSAGPPFMSDFPPAHVVLHSLASAERAVNKTLIVPSAVAMAANVASLMIIGVQVESSSPTWQVDIFLWNQPFINGSTTVQDILSSGGVVMVESPTPPGVNSAAMAQKAVTPPTVCRTTSGSSQPQDCQTMTGSGSYVVTENGLSVVVNKFGNEVSWTDDRQLMFVDMEGGAGISMSQLLALSESMT